MIQPRSSGYLSRILRKAVLPLLVLLAIASEAAANGSALPAPLAPYEAEYRVSKGPMTLGRSTTTLKSVTGGWEYRTVAQATGVAKMFVSGDAVERTLLSSNGHSLRTLRYQRRMPDDDGRARVDFDWDHYQARIDHSEDGALIVPLSDSTHDPHAAILTVMIALANGNEVPSFSVVEDDGDVSYLDFRVDRDKQIQVPFGSFETVRVTRIRHDKDRKLIAWFAPELDWLPVRIEQIDDGSTVASMDLQVLDGDEGEAGDDRRRALQGP